MTFFSRGQEKAVLKEYIQNGSEFASAVSHQKRETFKRKEYVPRKPVS